VEGTYAQTLTVQGTRVCTQGAIFGFLNFALFYTVGPLWWKFLGWM